MHAAMHKLRPILDPELLLAKAPLPSSFPNTEQEEREWTLEDWIELRYTLKRTEDEGEKAWKTMASATSVIWKFLEEEGGQLGGWTWCASTTRSGTLIEADFGLSYRDTLISRVEELRERRAREYEARHAAPPARAPPASTTILGTSTIASRQPLDAEPLPRPSSSGFSRSSSAPDMHVPAAVAGEDDDDDDEFCSFEELGEFALR